MIWKPLREFSQAIAIAKGTPEIPLVEPEDLYNAKIVGVTPQSSRVRNRRRHDGHRSRRIDVTSQGDHTAMTRIHFIRRKRRPDSGQTNRSLSRSSSKTWTVAEISMSVCSACKKSLVRASVFGGSMVSSGRDANSLDSGTQRIFTCRITRTGGKRRCHPHAPLRLRSQ